MGESTARDIQLPIFDDLKCSRSSMDRTEVSEFERLSLVSDQTMSKSAVQFSRVLTEHEDTFATILDAK